MRFSAIKLGFVLTTSCVVFAEQCPAISDIVKNGILVVPAGYSENTVTKNAGMPADQYNFALYTVQLTNMINTITGQSTYSATCNYNTRLGDNKPFFSITRKLDVAPVPLAPNDPNWVTITRNFSYNQNASWKNPDNSIVSCPNSSMISGQITSPNDWMIIAPTEAYTFNQVSLSKTEVKTLTGSRYDLQAVCSYVYATPNTYSLVPIFKSEAAIDESSNLTPNDTTWNAKSSEYHYQDTAARSIEPADAPWQTTQSK